MIKGIPNTLFCHPSTLSQFHLASKSYHRHLSASQHISYWIGLKKPLNFHLLLTEVSFTVLPTMWLSGTFWSTLVFHFWYVTMATFPFWGSGADVARATISSTLQFLKHTNAHHMPDRCTCACLDSAQTDSNINHIFCAVTLIKLKSTQLFLTGLEHSLDGRVVIHACRGSKSHYD